MKYVGFNCNDANRAYYKKYVSHWLSMFDVQRQIIGTYDENNPITFKHLIDRNDTSEILLGKKLKRWCECVSV